MTVRGASAHAIAELRLLWFSGIAPAVLGLLVLLVAANVLAGAQAVQANYDRVQQTRANYAANGMDFDADLRLPPDVTEGDIGTGNIGTGNISTEVNNLARYDYDAAAASIVALRPGSSVNQTLGYFDFLVFPIALYLVGLGLATTQRRARLEKVALVRVGAAGLALARLLVVVVVGAGLATVSLLTDVVSRGLAYAVVAARVPVDDFPPLAAPPQQHPALQLAVTALVVLFFGWAGLAVGALTGSFAASALIFVAWDLVLPILAVHDPRNWFAALGHAVFTYAPPFELVAAIPFAPALAAGATAACCALFAVGALFALRLRNPMAQ